MNKISNQMNDDGGITNQQKQQRVEKSEMKWIELKMKMELRRESGKRLWQWRWRARTNERAFTHSVVCAPARWRPETNKNHEELQIELIHTRMPKWMNKKKWKTHTHTASKKQSQALPKPKYSRWYWINRSNTKCFWNTISSHRIWFSIWIQ